MLFMSGQLCGTTAPSSNSCSLFLFSIACFWSCSNRYCPLYRHTCKLPYGTTSQKFCSLFFVSIFTLLIRSYYNGYDWWVYSADDFSHFKKLLGSYCPHSFSLLVVCCINSSLLLSPLFISALSYIFLLSIIANVATLRMFCWMLLVEPMISWRLVIHSCATTFWCENTTTYLVQMADFFSLFFYFYYFGFLSNSTANPCLPSFVYEQTRYLCVTVLVDDEYQVIEMIVVLLKSLDEKRNRFKTFVRLYFPAPTSSFCDWNSLAYGKYVIDRIMKKLSEALQPFVLYLEKVKGYDFRCLLGPQSPVFVLLKSLHYSFSVMPWSLHYVFCEWIGVWEQPDSAGPRFKYYSNRPPTSNSS